MTQWSTRVVLVTGGSRGIGAGIVEHFLKLGCKVITTSTTEIGVDAIIKKHNNSNLLACLLNLAQQDAISALLAHIKAQGLTIDTLVNNAGMTDDQLSIQITPERWHNLLNTNLSGTFFLTQGVLKSMIRERFGRIISLSSVVALTGNPGQSSYCASKAGLIGLMKSIALEVASRSITVNTIAPGFIETEMTDKISEAKREQFKLKIPMTYFGTAQDMAHTCEFLASDGARYITGQTLHVNGGLF